MVGLARRVEVGEDLECARSPIAPRILTEEALVPSLVAFQWLREDGDCSDREVECRVPIEGWRSWVDAGG